MKNDSLYIMQNVGNKPNSNLFFAKYFKSNFFTLSIDNTTIFSEVRKYDSDFLGEPGPNGIFNVNYTSIIDKMNIYVENHVKISDNLYECKSRYLYMVLNNEYTTLGIFKNEIFYIQLVERNNYILLSIFKAGGFI